MALPLRGLASDFLVPDDLFAIQGNDEKGTWYRRYAIEIDRNTESIERRHLEHKSFGHKVAAYLQVFRERTFHFHRGLRELSLLIVTTTPGHALNLLEYIRREAEPKLAEKFAVAVLPEFGVNWRVPKAVQYQLLDEPWQTVTGDKYIGTP